MSASKPQITEQSGSASSTPSKFYRFLSSRVMRRMASEEQLNKRRERSEKKRLASGEPHVVEYFHQLDDPHSHLASQCLAPLLERYDIELRCHIVSAPTRENASEPELMRKQARYDAGMIAPYYGLGYPDRTHAPRSADVETALRVLSNAPEAEFPRLGVTLSGLLLMGDRELLLRFAESEGLAETAAAQSRVAQGNARRAELNHYSSAMFYYAGEWYWGVDRLCHLEQRLQQLGAVKDENRPEVAPRPAIRARHQAVLKGLKLEFYPSLRSPYTSIIFDATLAYAEAASIELIMRPVLPMVMRGVPATRQKGQYIFSDTAREARLLGLEWGKVYDPIGEPVKRAYSLYPWALKNGRGNELLREFLQAAFFDGVNTNSERGLRRVVERAGLSWQEAQTVLGNDAWQTEFEVNRQTMYDFNSWGVPSYRLLDANNQTLLTAWGQDRLWLVSHVVARLDQEFGLARS